MGDTIWSPIKELNGMTIIPFTSVISHPLEIKTSKKKIIEEDKEDEEKLYDPLGSSSDHPLDDLHFDHDSNNKTDTVILRNTLETEAIVPCDEVSLPNFEGWNERRKKMMSEIVKKEEGNKGERRLMGIRAQHRLDLLEDMSGLKKLIGLNEEEYVSGMRIVRETLLFAWKNNKRIEALQLISETARNLSSINTSPSFYPIQFCLVTQILDTFGQLVYERLLNKANEYRLTHNDGKLSSSFTSKHIDEATKTTAKNWLIKASEIRDPLAKLYVTAAISRCLSFYDSSLLSSHWITLATHCSFQNPIVSAYARAYISKQAMYENPSNRAPHWKLINDWMQSFTPIPEYEVVGSALEWLISCVSYNACTRHDISPLWEYASHSDKRRLFLLPFLNGLPPSYLASHITDACQIVCSPNAIVRGSELKALILPLLSHSTLPQSRALVLRSVWRSTMRLQSIIEFVEASSPLPSLVASHFSLHEVNVLCTSIYNRLQSHSSPYQSFISNVLSSIAQSSPQSISSFILLESFHSLLSLLIDSDSSSNASYSILTSFINHHSIASIHDYSVANQLLYLCTHLKSPYRSIDKDNGHDSLIISTIDRVSFDDGERTLEWLVSIRASMSQRERVIKHTISHACSLVLRMCSQQGKERGGLKVTRSSLAFIHITIPSLDHSIDRLICISRGTIAALAAAALPQADALCRLGLECLQDVDSVPSALSILLPLLILLPDSPDRTPLYMMNGLVNVIDRRDWTGKENELVDSLVLCLDALSSISINNLPLKVINTMSNDEMYYESDEMKESISSLSSHIIDRLSTLSSSYPQSSHSFIIHFITRCNPTPQSIELISYLLNSIGRSFPFKNQLVTVIRLIRSNPQWYKHIQV